MPLSAQGDPVHSLLEKARESLVFSGFQLYAKKDRALILSGGVTSYWPGSRAVTADTLFDIGSVTKAVTTTSLCALAVDQSTLRVSDTVGQWVPEWKSSAVSELTVRDLLCHAAGLRDWWPIYREQSITPGFLRRWVVDHGEQWVVARPGERTEYSDLGFLILGEVLAEVWKQPLAQAFRAYVAEPLGMQGVKYGPVKNAEVVATEVRDGKPLQGIVFDENSAALGHATSHAGLFSNAASLAPWCEAWLGALSGKSKWLGQSTAALFTKKAARVATSSWALGWDTKSPKGSSAGNLFSETSFGHLGYPGCSVWIDPVRKTYAIFLTNRVHPSRLDERIRKLRPVLHDAIAKGWGE